MRSSFEAKRQHITAASSLRATERYPEFRFTAKSHRSWTHERSGDLARSITPTLAGLRPVLESGRLGALLVQFPRSFHHTAGATDYLDQLLER